MFFFFFFSSRRRHTRCSRDWSSDVCSSDLARGEGLDVMADVYPYTASSTTLRTLLPDWALEDGVEAMLERLGKPEVRERIRRELEAPVTGQSLLDRVGWENIMIASGARRKDAEGKRLSEGGAARGLDPLEAAVA